MSRIHQDTRVIDGGFSSCGGYLLRPFQFSDGGHGNTQVTTMWASFISLSEFVFSKWKKEEGGPDTNTNPFPVKQKSRGSISEAEGKCTGVG